MSIPNHLKLLRRAYVLPFCQLVPIVVTVPCVSKRDHFYIVKLGSTILKEITVQSNFLPLPTMMKYTHLLHSTQPTYPTVSFKELVKCILVEFDGARLKL